MIELTEGKVLSRGDANKGRLADFCLFSACRTRVERQNRGNWTASSLRAASVAEHASRLLDMMTDNLRER